MDAGISANDRGVIDYMFNMVCANGHKTFTPFPDYWRNHQCGRSIGPRHRCTGILVPLWS